MKIAKAAVPSPVKLPKIDAVERVRRVAAVESVTGTFRMEGLYATPLSADLEQRYIAGELSTGDMLEIVKAKYKR